MRFRSYERGLGGVARRLAQDAVCPARAPGADHQARCVGQRRRRRRLDVVAGEQAAALTSTETAAGTITVTVEPRLNTSSSTSAPGGVASRRSRTIVPKKQRHDE